MNNFKNLKELYQALLDGKTITNGRNLVRMKDEDNLEILYEDTTAWRETTWNFPNAQTWSIYQESDRWYKVTTHHKKGKRPTIWLCLYKSEEDFLELNEAKKEDYHWIILEEVEL